MVRALIASRSTPLGVRVALIALIASLLNPIDLIPEFIPVPGPLDDVVVAVLVLSYVRRRLGTMSCGVAGPAPRRALRCCVRSWASCIQDGPAVAGQLGSSMRFRVDKMREDQRPARSEFNPSRLPQVILEPSLIEVGPTPFPLYSGATAGASTGTHPPLQAADVARGVPSIAQPASGG